MESVLEQKRVGEDRRARSGIIFTHRVSTVQSNNAIAVFEYEALPGSEPPRHIHTREDEIVIIKEGTVTFFVGDDIIEAGPGSIVYMPVNVPHHFVITSPMAKGILIATPGNIDHFFRQFSVPYLGAAIPPVTTPTPEQISSFVALSERFGMRFV